MFFPVTSLLLATLASSALAAPLPEILDLDGMNVDRRFLGLGSKKPPPPTKAPPKVVAAPPVVKVTPPVVKVTPPVVKATPPAVKVTPPAVIVKTTAAAVKTTPAVLTTKATSVAPAAAKTTSVKTSAVLSSVTSSASASPTDACLLPTSTVAVPKQSLADKLKSIFRRDTTEFIGWHGTNAKTADLWTSKGSIVKPVNDDGSVAGSSPLDAELGPGLYIADTLSVAEVAASINGQHNSLAPKVCAIFAKSSTAWRQNVIKAQIPDVIRGNGAQNEKIRLQYLALLPRPGNANSVKFGPLSATTNQLVIPESVNPTLQAQCFDVDAQGNSAGAAAIDPKIKYTNGATSAPWEIIKGDNDLANAAKAAITQGCKPPK